MQRYGRLVRYQTPHFCYLQRIFSSSLPQSEIGYSRKDSLQIVGCSDFLSLPSFKHVKRQSDDGYAVTDTFHRAFNEWKDNCVYITDLVMVLNHKIAQWYEKNMELAKLYDKYYHAPACYAEDNLKGAKLQYYYRVTD